MIVAAYSFGLIVATKLLLCFLWDSVIGGTNWRMEFFALRNCLEWPLFLYAIVWDSKSILVVSTIIFFSNSLSRLLIYRDTWLGKRSSIFHYQARSRIPSSNLPKYHQSSSSPHFFLPSIPHHSRMLLSLSTLPVLGSYNSSTSHKD